MYVYLGYTLIRQFKAQKNHRGKGSNRDGQKGSYHFHASGEEYENGFCLLLAYTFILHLKEEK